MIDGNNSKHKSQLVFTPFLVADILVRISGQL